MSEGKLRRAFRRLTTDDDALAAEELQSQCTALGATPIADAAERRPMRLHGTIQSVTLRPRAGVPALEAEIYDGTGTVYVVWLGRRRIAGIEPGVALVVEGRIGQAGNRRTLFNPAYTLLPRRA